MTRSGKFLLLTLKEFEEWLVGTTISRSVGIIQNHHTMEPAYGSFTPTSHFRLLEAMEHYHVVEMGFSEIAQNLTTFPDGSLAVCRSMEKIPAGIKGANQKGVCIEHLGNFDENMDKMTSEQRAAVIGVNACLCRKFRLKPGNDTIVYHHWYDLATGLRTNGAGTTKSCPGAAFFEGNSVEAAEAYFYPAIVAVLGSAGDEAPSAAALR
jgi:N-acetylmuramoyl-L-alanine amidase